MNNLKKVLLDSTKNIGGSLETKGESKQAAGGHSLNIDKNIQVQTGV